MLFEPTLLVREVAIYRGSSHAYRGSFHEGVNIVSGENSSGKSTILSLIIYGLGADISNWSEHAKLCDRVSIEVALNDHIVTVSRLISPQAGQPMEIFSGGLEAAEAAPHTAWLRYPYRTSASRESFSQAMFRFLNIPELETEASGKLTMHQVLRVLYSDQLSAVEKIFRDDNFDSPALREAVGRLLFGAYEGDIYANQLKIREFEKELATIEASLRSIYTLLAGVEHSLTLDWVAAERRKIEQEMQALDVEIVEAESSHYSEAANEGVSLDPLNRAFSEAQRAQIEMTKVEDAETALQLEHADSEMFIITLERKIRALQDLSSVASAISEIHYAWCPSCFAPLAADNNPSACRLCKEPFDEERLRRRIVNQLNDMIIQLKQSRALQAARSQDVVALARRKAELREQWEAARRELSKVRRAPTSNARDRLRALNERSGYLKRELEGISEKAALIERLDRMSRQKVELAAAIAGLVDANDRLKATEAERLSKAYTEVAQQTVYFLHHDLPRQDFVPERPNGQLQLLEGHHLCRRTVLLLGVLNGLSEERLPHCVSPSGFPERAVSPSSLFGFGHHRGQGNGARTQPKLPEAAGGTLIRARPSPSDHLRDRHDQSRFRQ